MTKFKILAVACAATAMLALGRRLRRLGAIEDAQDHRPLHAGQRPRHHLPPDGRADPKGRRADRGGREPPRRRHDHRHRGRGPRRARRQHRAAGRQRLRGQHGGEARQLHAREFRAGLQSRLDADAARGAGSAPWKTLQELVADAKANPGKITFASGGPATSLHIAIEVLRLATKIDINYVPYGGSGPADQRADGRPRAGGLGRLSDRGVAAQGRHAPRARHHLAEAARACCPACRSWRKPASPNTRPRFSTASSRRRKRRPRRSRTSPTCCSPR